jgi:hypothetical protein
MSVLSWSHPDADPLADIQEAMQAFQAANDAGFAPNVLIVSQRVHFRLIRRTMTKRQFRRYRGRIKEATRAWINAGRPE